MAVRITTVYLGCDQKPRHCSSALTEITMTKRISILNDPMGSIAFIENTHPDLAWRLKRQVATKLMELTAMGHVDKCATEFTNLSTEEAAMVFKYKPNDVDDVFRLALYIPGSDGRRQYALFVIDLQRDMCFDLSDNLL